MQRTWWLLWKPFWKIRNLLSASSYTLSSIFLISLNRRVTGGCVKKSAFKAGLKKKSKWCYSNQCKFLLIILNKIYASENTDIFRNKMYYLNYPPCANSLVRNSQRSLPRKILTGEHRSELFWQKMSVFHR